MGTLITEVLENTFVKKASSSYNLSVLVGADRFTILVRGAQQIHALRTYFLPNTDDLGELKANLHKIYLNDSLLKLSYGAVNIVRFHHKTTLVPNRLYQEEGETIYLEKMMTLTASDQILIDELKTLDSKNIYVIDKGLETIFKSYYPHARFIHATTPFLLGTYKLSEHRSGQQLYVNVQDKKLHLVLYQNGELLFSNVFAYQSSKDFLYYTLLIFEQFQLKPEAVPLYLAGQVVKESEVYQLLYRYIRHMHFVQAPEYFRIGTSFQRLPAHQFFDLLSLKLCES